MSLRVSGDTFQAEVLESPVPVLVDFYSDSCVPCKRMNPIISKLEPEFEGRAKFVKVNVNFDLDLAQRYAVMASPTFVLIKGGQEVARNQGTMAKGDLSKLVEKTL